MPSRIRESINPKFAVLSGEYISTTATTPDEPAMEKYNVIGDSCSSLDEECPDGGNLQSKELKNKIRFEKNKAGRQRKKSKT